MPCYHPVPARQDARGSPVVLHPPVGEANLSLPCGVCVGCRTVRATEWSRRCMHEAARFDNNVFVTLTYSDERVPSDGNLVPRHLQLFLKRLRKAARSSVVLRDASCGIRFFGSGEYGEQTGRPHYHVLLFNCDFSDKERVGKELWSSPLVSELWRDGEHKIGTVTARSANYVAQYSMKKMGSRLDCDSDGVIRQRPFLRMSRRPGIGHDFVVRYSKDLEHGFLVHDGARSRIPRAYKKKLDSEVVASYEAAQLVRARDNPSDRNSPNRLRAGEVIALRRADSHFL